MPRQLKPFSHNHLIAALEAAAPPRSTFGMIEFRSETLRSSRKDENGGIACFAKYAKRCSTLLWPRGFLLQEPAPEFAADAVDCSGKFSWPSVHPAALSYRLVRASARHAARQRPTRTTWRPSTLPRPVPRCRLVRLRSHRRG